MEKIILTDCDGVLCDWDTAFTKFMHEKGYPMLPGTEDQYLLSKRHNISFELASAFVKEFNESEYISDLKPFADSVEYVGRLAERGFTFIVVSSVSDNPVSRYYREKNVKNIFGDIFSDVVCIGQGLSKTETLRHWQGSGYFWIEDHMKQAESGYEVGLSPVLISHPYNRHYSTDLFPKVSFERPWEEIYNMVMDRYGYN